jgi:hypothetical protein
MAIGVSGFVVYSKRLSIPLEQSSTFMVYFIDSFIGTIRQVSVSAMYLQTTKEGQSRRKAERKMKGSLRENHFPSPISIITIRFSFGNEGRVKNSKINIGAGKQLKWE